MSRSARLSELLEGSHVEPVVAIGADPEILGAAVDSRRIEPGDLFVAIRGYQRDGEAYVDDAVRRGARAVVARSPRPAALESGIGWVQVDEPRRAAALLARECYGRPDEAISLVGVTGTNGKTTVTHLLESIGSAAGRRSGRIGTIGGAFGNQERELARTTPEAPDFYRLLDEMRAHGVDLVAVEVSSHALALSRVEGARFAVAAFLNLSRDHLDFHGDDEAYFEAKARLFDSLSADRCAVLPADSPHGERLRGRCAARVLSFGRGAGADVRLRDEHCGLGGSSAILDTPSGKLPVRTFLLGSHNLDNIAAAAACALALDLPPESIPSGVLAVTGIRGRLERVDRGQPFTILIDYAHTPAALQNLLGWLRSVTDGKLHVVFGCGGARDVSKRPDMGRVAANHADRVYLTSDNPRSEDPRAILAQIASGIPRDRGSRTRLVVDRREAIRAALAGAQSGDVVAVAGKGHETVQVIGNEKRPFDDRLVVEQALEELGWRGNGVADA